LDSVPATEDLFTTIHKGLRSMIYHLGGRLQTNDFADLAGTGVLLTDLEHDFAVARSAGCIVCALQHHAGEEDSTIFPSVSKYAPGLVASLIEEHHELTRRELALAKRGHELLALPSAEDRVREGQALNRSANDLFALYLAHMNREDEWLVPLMREHFTNEQMATMRGTIMSGMPPERLMAILRWMLPSLNIGELAEILSVIQRTTPPPVWAAVTRLGETHVDPGRWTSARRRIAA
jgi:Hemerythrin HHE cation binding domain